MNPSGDDFILSHPSILTIKHSDGWTPLFPACQNGKLEIISKLLFHGVNVDGNDKDGRTPLHLACFNGHTHVLPTLAEYNPSYNAVDNWGRTALHWASRQGHSDTVKFLIKQGADLNCVDKWGFTALHWACVSGHTDVADLLSDAGSTTVDSDMRQLLEMEHRLLLSKEKHRDTNRSSNRTEEEEDEYIEVNDDSNDGNKSGSDGNGSGNNGKGSLSLSPLEGMKRELNVTAIALETVTKVSESLRVQLQDSESRVVELEGRLDAMQERYASGQSMLTTTMERLVFADEELSRQQKAFHDSEQRCMELEGQCRVTAKQMEELQHSVGQAAMDKMETKSIVTSLKMELSETKFKLSEALSSNNNANETRKLRDSVRRNEELEKRLQDCDRELQYMQTQLRLNQVKLTDSESRAESHKHTLQDAEGRLRINEQHLHVTTAKLESCETRLSDSTRLLESAKKEIETLRNKVDALVLEKSPQVIEKSLRSQLAVVELRAARSEQAVSELQRTLDDRNEQHSASHGLLERMGNELSELTEELTNVKSQLRVYTEKPSKTIMTQTEVWLLEATEPQEMSVSASAKFAAADKANSREFSDSQRELNDTKKELSDMTNRMMELRGELLDAKCQLVELQIRLSKDGGVGYGSKGDTNNPSSNEDDSELLEAYRQLTAYNEQLYVFKRQILSKDVEIGNMNGELTALRRDLRHAEEKNAELENTVKDLGIELTRTKKTVVQLKLNVLSMESTRLETDRAEIAGRRLLLEDGTDNFNFNSCELSEGGGGSVSKHHRDSNSSSSGSSSNSNKTGRATVNEAMAMVSTSDKNEVTKIIASQRSVFEKAMEDMDMALNAMVLRVTAAERRMSRLSSALQLSMMKCYEHETQLAVTNQELDDTRLKLERALAAVAEERKNSISQEPEDQDSSVYGEGTKLKGKGKMTFGNNKGMISDSSRREQEEDGGMGDSSDVTERQMAQLEARYSDLVGQHLMVRGSLEAANVQIAALSSQLSEANRLLGLSRDENATLMTRSATAHIRFPASPSSGSGGVDDLHMDYDNSTADRDRDRERTSSENDSALIKKLQSQLSSWRKVSWSVGGTAPGDVLNDMEVQLADARSRLEMADNTIHTLRKKLEEATGTGTGTGNAKHFAIATDIAGSSGVDMSRKT
eukprot:gene77-94_t